MNKAFLGDGIPDGFDKIHVRPKKEIYCHHLKDKENEKER